MKVSLKNNMAKEFLLIKTTKKLFKLMLIDFKPTSKCGIFAKRLLY